MNVETFIMSGARRDAHERHKRMMKQKAFERAINHARSNSKGTFNFLKNAMKSYDQPENRNEKILSKYGTFRFKNKAFSRFSKKLKNRSIPVSSVAPVMPPVSAIAPSPIVPPVSAIAPSPIVPPVSAIAPIQEIEEKEEKGIPILPILLVGGGVAYMMMKKKKRGRR